jgi:AraC-like DNA-binding protein
VTYRERAIGVPGVLLWQRSPRSEPTSTVVLPDGCLDLIWDGRRLFVAGPDSTAHRHLTPPGAAYAALRFAGGSGPAALGVPADELTDRSPELADLWPAAAARELTERVADDPVGVLAAWVSARAAAAPVDPIGPVTLALADQGAPVSVMADRLGLSTRQLHRRCLPLFGYGPRRLGRVLRLTRAYGKAVAGVPLATVAADCGYADQAHLTREVRLLAGVPPAALLRESGLR